ncbi:Hypothetical protein HDN1F_32410 [gamma proteobacterium HdN1]|nr:Hypothetical protein HDN1F_32410 [gamma proteobacterium HdN1]
MVTPAKDTRLIDAIDAIDALLPQTQCRQCGYPACRPYAKAVVNGEASNLCAPGGNRVAQAISEALQRPYLPVAPDHDTSTEPRLLAVIREDECIGCTKCIQACPVDAILGAAQLMHTVIGDQCTGCNLCVEPCPVDCIDMVAMPELPMPEAALSRSRYLAQTERKARERQEKRAKKEHREAIESPTLASHEAPITTRTYGESQPAALTIPAPPSTPSPPSAPSSPLEAASLVALQSAWNIAQKRWKDANKALQVACKAKSAQPNMAAMQTKVEQLHARAEQARLALDAARTHKPPA